ncbi:MAG TPA: hypothetical protein VNG32_05185 [Candidatus Dormibacteraeota bacterium]|nr:hypothetical protein [Candidatus Dormibacteraeota bacterium]
MNANAMATPKKYFHDHFVLLLLSINVFLAFADSIYILVRLGTSHGSGYIVQYRPSLGISAYQAGSILELFSFVGFAIIVLVTNTTLSLRAYKIHRQLAVTILCLGILLLLLTIIISNALLVLH